jgi:hypothetical protein
MAIAVHQYGELPLRHFGEAAGLGEFDEGTAPLGLLRGLRPRPGVEEREFCHPLRRLPRHLEDDVAAHR